MPTPRFIGLLGGIAVWSLSALSHAQCAKDTDCKGDRVCDAGKCVAPAAAAPAATPAPAAPAPVPPAAPAAAPPTTAAPPPPAKVRMERHSTGMMVGGIVMVALAPVALLTSGIARIGKGICDVDDERGCDEDYDPTIYGALLTGVALIGVGIPLLVIGAKKEPVDDTTATISPWASPDAGGLVLRVDM